jgi:hypothetical protein
MTTDSPTSKTDVDASSPKTDLPQPDPSEVPANAGAAADAAQALPRREVIRKKVKQALPFIASWLLLDAMLNMRYPAAEPALWYLIPSVDVIVLFAYFGVFGWNKWRVPAVARAFAVLLIFLVRCIRLGDGAMKKVYFAPFNVYTDLQLVPKLVSFSFDTLAGWKVYFILVLIGLGAAVLAVATYKALACAERYLTNFENMRNVTVFTFASFVILSFIPHDPYVDDLYFGGFASSAVPRVKHEAKFLLNIYGYTEEKVRAIADAQDRLGKVPSNLAKLHRANVYLILVESYGQTVFEQPVLEEASRSTFDAFESELVGRGFSIVSGTLDSPTFAGQSWLAQSTLATGVHVSDQLQYELVTAGRPKTIAVFFGKAGYRTVLAHPGTQREWPQGEFHQFQQKYYAWNFRYAGPTFAWATMPDQFVLDFIRRSEVEKHTEPLFIEYALVTSHAPWSDLPVIVEDWSKIGNGSIYNRLPVTKFPITWPDFDDASQAYIRSIIYDFDVLKSYISEFVRDDSLVILLGDHQPVYEITGGDENHGVPLHVISRDRALLAPFEARGCVAGVRPRLEETRRPLESFLIDFLQDFSTPDAPATGN